MQIILKARRNYLFEQYVIAQHANEVIIADLEESKGLKHCLSMVGIVTICVAARYVNVACILHR